MTRIIDSNAAMQTAYAEATALLNASDAAGAIALADDFTAAAGQQINVTQMQAAMCTDGGRVLGRRDLVERGAALWRSLDPESNLTIAYNLANAEMAIYELAVAQGGLPAWEHEQEHLRTARTIYERIGEDTSAPRELRLQALTNAGNAYDVVGRNLDALTRYDCALAIAPDFGMAHGNRGLALYYFAPFVREHAPAILRLAADALDAAIDHRDSVTRFGGPRALRRFEEVRKQIQAPTTPAREQPGSGSWKDAHLAWCRRHGLFLHVSHDCLYADTPVLDPLFFRSVVTENGDAGQQRMRDLVDAFNALKQEYVAARYVTWLASDQTSPIRDHAGTVSERITFLDSLEHARWGVRTGMATQAFTSATNVLDKVASFVHLYLGTTRPTSGVSFAALWRAGAKKPMDRELAASLGPPQLNIGLLALCDLSCDLRAETPLKRRILLRHTATHRFLVAHTEMMPPSNGWFDRMRWRDLLNDTLAQLHVARAALMYLARLIDTHESRNRSGAPSTGPAIPPLIIPGVNTRLAEYE